MSAARFSHVGRRAALRAAVLWFVVFHRFYLRYDLPLPFPRLGADQPLRLSWLIVHEIHASLIKLMFTASVESGHCENAGEQ